MREVGIIIRTTDASSKEIGEIANAVNQFANKSEANFKKAEKSGVGFAIKLNMVLKAAKIAARAVEEFFRFTVGSSLESRDAMDPMRKAWDQIAKSVTDLAVHVGDALLPALVAIGQSFEPIINGMDAWIRKNQEFIGQKFITMVEYAAKVMTIFFGAIALAGSRLYTVFVTIALKVAEFGSILLKGLTEPLRDLVNSIAIALEAIGQGAAATKMKRLVSIIYEGGAAAEYFKRKSQEANQAQAEFEDSIDETSQAIFDAFEGTGARAAENFKQKIIRTRTEIKKNEEAMRAWDEREKEFLDELRDIIAEASDDITKMIRKRGEAWEREADLAEKAGQAADEYADGIRQQAEDIGSAITQVFNDLRSEYKGIGDVQSETIQKIAIKSKNGADSVERYVSSISAAEIANLKRVGKTAEVVSETIAIRTKSAADAMEAVFGRVIDAIIGRLTALFAEKVVELFLGLFAGSASGGFGFAGGILPMLTQGLNFSNLAHGGYVQRAAGGLVVGGAAGKDSVPILAMPGERVLSRAETRIYERQVSAPSSAASQRPVVQQNILAFTPNRTDLRRFQRDVWEPEQKILRKRGIIKADR